MGFVFVLIGIGLIIYGYSSVSKKSDKSKTYVEVVASVVDYESRYNSDNERLYASIVEYTVNGKKYESTSSTSSSVKEPLGTKIRLKYNPNNPSEVIWVDDHGNFVLFIVGGVFIVTGVFVAISAALHGKKKQKDNEQQINTFDNTCTNELTQQENGLYNNPDIINEIDTNVSQNTNNNQNNINM